MVRGLNTEPDPIRCYQFLEASAASCDIDRLLRLDAHQSRRMIPTEVTRAAFYWSVASNRFRGRPTEARQLPALFVECSGRCTAFSIGPRSLGGLMEPRLEPHEFLGLPVDNGGGISSWNLVVPRSLLNRRGRGG